MTITTYADGNVLTAAKMNKDVMNSSTYRTYTITSSSFSSLANGASRTELNLTSGSGLLLGMTLIARVNSGENLAEIKVCLTVDDVVILNYVPITGCSEESPLTVTSSAMFMMPFGTSGSTTKLKIIIRNDSGAAMATGTDIYYYLDV
jgi:hypothetical protein